MNGNGLFIVIDGIDYAGKSSVLEGIVINNGIITPEYQIYDGIPKEMGDKSKYNKKGSSPKDRFDFYMNTNIEFSYRIENEIVNSNSILVRYALSTTAFHNKKIEELEGTNPYLENTIDKSKILTPDMSFIICSSKDDLEGRMKNRLPDHMYESNSSYLMSVQDEFIRLSRDNNNGSLFGNVVLIDNKENKLNETIKIVNDYIAKYTENKCY